MSENTTIGGRDLRMCAWCGSHHMRGSVCPSVKAIEYYPDGTMKRVEFIEPKAVDLPGLRDFLAHGGKT